MTNAVLASDDLIRPQDFPEDFDKENGNYWHNCECGLTFTGHKRRGNRCKICTEKINPKVERKSSMEDKQESCPIKETKQFRKDLDKTLQSIKEPATGRNSRERSLAITKIQEGIMWLGMDLKDQNEANPYPESKNPDNTKIEPTADGLKLQSLNRAGRAINLTKRK